MSQQVINLLKSAEGPSRELDAEIALASGYQLLGQAGPWKTPTGETVDRVPFFTQIIDHAIELAELAGPIYDGGCSWEAGKGSAIVDQGYTVEAVNPAIAICIAALERVQRRAHINAG